MERDTKELFVRHHTNPILSARDWSYPVNTVFNPGAVRFGDQHLLLCRCEDQREDARITYLEEMGRYAIVYTSFSRGGPLVSLALTEDFQNLEKLGAIVPPEDKDAALFPKKIKGEYLLIHRPSTTFALGFHIWLSSSPDLQHWGKHKGCQ